MTGAALVGALVAAFCAGHAAATYARAHAAWFGLAALVLGFLALAGCASHDAMPMAAPTPVCCEHSCSYTVSFPLTCPEGPPPPRKKRPA